MEPGGARGNSCRSGADYALKLRIIVKRLLAQAERQREAGGRKHADHETQEQQDRGEGHAPPGGKEKRQSPRGHRYGQRAQEGGTVNADGG